MSAFASLHALAATWGQLSIYSLWYPVAGVRFALLWRFGPGLTPALALSDLLVHLAWGNLAKPPGEALPFAASVVLPVCAYGVAIALVKRSEQRSAEGAGHTPMSLASGMAFAPALAATCSLPWHLLGKDVSALDSLLEGLSAALVFLVGDVLGVLIVAPPLLWLFGLRDRRRKEPLSRLTAGKLAEAVSAVALAAVVPAITVRAGFGLRLEPMLLAVVWVGLRLGTAAAWMALAPVAAFVLFLVPANVDPSTRMGLHMLMASLAVAGYAAGSYSEEHARRLLEISRRDRLLYHAHRLKTLRAMSVAIIHELAQPLSVLAIESRNLRELSRAPTIDQHELSAVAHLIERKSTGLAELASRLRAFGARGEAKSAPVDLDELLREVIGIVQLEAKATRVAIRLQADCGARVDGNGLELQQVFVNLLRNAILASAGEEVLVASRKGDAEVVVQIDNPVRVASEDPNGMGVGLIIARTIIEAHGGELNRNEQHGGMRHTIRLPLDDERHAR